MGRFLCFCLPRQEKEAKKKASEKSTNDHLDSPSSSSHNLSLSSQPSLPPDVPPLTISPSYTTSKHDCAVVLRGHTSAVSSLYLSAGSNLLISGSYDNQIRIWRLPPHSTEHNVLSPCTTETHSCTTTVNTSGAVKSIVVIRDGSDSHYYSYKIFTAHQDHKIRVWKLTNDSPSSSTNQNDKQRSKPSSTNSSLHLRKVAILPTATQDCLLSLFPTASNINRHSDTVSALAVSRDGCYLYSASWDRTVKIWRTSKDQIRCVETIMRAHDDAINAIAVSGDGKVVVTASADKSVRIWRKEEVQKKKKNENHRPRHLLVGTLQKHKSAVNAVVVSEDGGLVYSGGNDRLILVWEKGGGGEESEMVAVGAIRGHGNAVLCLAAVVGGGGCEIVCSGSADKTVRVWRRRKSSGYSYVCLAVLEGHSRPVKCLAVAEVDQKHDDSILVYSGGLDCDIRIWKIPIPSP